jgi:hypothetical protein
MNAARALAGLGVVFTLAACSGATDDEGVGVSEDAVAMAETVTAPTGTVPRRLRVSTAAAKCPLPTDCSRAWTDRFVEDVFVKHDPDIVVMTELFWGGTYDNVVNQIGRRRPRVYNFYRAPGPSTWSAAGGTVIASKYPMSRKAQYIYDADRYPDRLTNKGTGVARQHLGVLASGEPVDVDVLATHLQAKTEGDFTATIRAQMVEQSRFLSGANVWGGGGATLKIYTGDLNVSGAGPSWLGGADVAKGANVWGWLRDNTIRTYGLRDGVDTCANGTDRAAACATRPFVEKEPWEVVKQLYVPYAKLSASRRGERGVYMIPEKHESFDTVSDHDAKEITYGLYVVMRSPQRDPAPHEE